MLEVKLLRIGSCCVRAVVWVKRGGSSVMIDVSTSPKKEFTNGDGIEVQANHSRLISSVS